MKVYDELNLLDPKVVVGQHGIWLPDQQIKVPFQWGGSIQKYQKITEQRYDRTLIGEEVALLRALHMMGWAPRIGDWVYFKTVISTHPGGWWADPCGAYGYEMADARQGPAGSYTFEAFRDSGLVTGTPGAWNDLKKPGNTVNGYLIDVRRSGWDRLRWRAEPEPVPVYEEPRDTLIADLMREGQFPFRERSQAYQEFLLGGEWHAAEREVRQRAEILGFQPWHGETILDIGTQLGGFLTYAATRLSRPHHAEYVGLDVQPEYVGLARRLARANGFNLCFRELNAFVEPYEVSRWLADLWPGGVGHCLLLSMLKHLPHGEADIWALYHALRPKHYYLETNAVKDGAEPPLHQGVKLRGGVLTGWSADRNRRACYKITRREDA